MPFVTHRTVLFGDVDPAGIVYYPRVLEYVHGAMEAFFDEALGLPYAELVAERRLGCATLRCEAEFRRPLRLGERVAIEVAIERVGASSIGWRYRFTGSGGGDPRIEVTVVTVLIDMDRVEKRQLPAELRDRLMKAVDG